MDFNYDVLIYTVLVKASICFPVFWLFGNVLHMGNIVI